MKEHLKLLGWKVKDRVNGFTGVVTHIGIDLMGCVQAIVRPDVSLGERGDQKLEPGEWFDTCRLERVGKAPVMKPIPVKGDLVVAGPDYGKPVK